MNQSNLTPSLLIQNLNQQREQQFQQQQLLFNQTQRAKLPFPTQRPGMLPHQPMSAGNNVSGGVNAATAAATANRIFQTNLISVLQQNMLNRNQLLSAMQSGQSAPGMAGRAGPPSAGQNGFQQSPGNVMDLCQLLSMAKENSKKMQQQSQQHAFHQEQLRHYHQCALIERMKHQSQIMNSQVTWHRPASLGLFGNCTFHLSASSYLPDPYISLIRSSAYLSSCSSYYIN